MMIHTNMNMITRKETLMILADAVEDGADSTRLAQIRRALPARRWDATVPMRTCPHCRVSGSAQAPCATCANTGKVEGVGITLHVNALSSYGERTVTMINPSEKQSGARYLGDQSPSYVFWFGAYGWTNIHVYAPDMDGAIETVAAWLVDHAPGHIMVEGCADLVELHKEACEEAGLAWPMPTFHMMVMAEDDLAGPYWKAFDKATEDLMYTESGYLTSHEWGIALENPTTEELYQFIKGGNA